MTAETGPFIPTTDRPFVRFDGVISMSIQQILISHCQLDVCDKIYFIKLLLRELYILHTVESKEV